MLGAICAKVIVETYGKKRDDKSKSANRLYVKFRARKAVSERLEKQERQSDDEPCSEADNSKPQTKLCPIPECVEHVLAPNYLIDRPESGYTS